MNEKKLLDINTFIAEIKRMIAEQPVLSNDGSRFYGKLGIYFEDGKINHIERFETIK